MYVILNRANFAYEFFILIKIFMEEIFNYYRIKTEWTKESSDGRLQKTKTEELVYAANYTDAESIAYALVEDQQRERLGNVSIEIVKTKITELLYNDTLEHDNVLIGGLVCNYFPEDTDSSVGIYSVKVVLPIIDEKTGAEKQQAETIFTPATSNTDAARRIDNYYKHSMRDYIIRDIKFDKAEAILWPPTIQQQKERDSVE